MGREVQSVPGGVTLSSMQKDKHKVGRARFVLHGGCGKKERRLLVHKMPDPFHREGLREAVGDEQEFDVQCDAHNFVEL